MKKGNSRLKAIAMTIKEHPFASWFIIYCIWLLDLTSTVFCLGTEPETFFEANPFAAYFFNFGLIGWIAWSIISGLLILVVLRLPDFYLWIIKHIKVKRKNRKTAKETYYYFLRMYVFFGFICSETLITIHNYYLYFRLMGLS